MRKKILICTLLFSLLFFCSISAGNATPTIAKGHDVIIEVIPLGLYPDSALPPGEAFNKFSWHSIAPEFDDPNGPLSALGGHWRATLTAKAYPGWVFLGFIYDKTKYSVLSELRVLQGNPLFTEYQSPEGVYWETEPFPIDYGSTFFKAAFTYVGTDSTLDAREMILPDKVPSIYTDNFSIQVPFSFEEKVQRVQLKTALSSDLTLLTANCTGIPLYSMDSGELVFYDVENTDTSISEGMISINAAINYNANQDQIIKTFDVIGGNNDYTDTSANGQTYIIPVADSEKQSVIERNNFKSRENPYQVKVEVVTQGSFPDTALPPGKAYAQLKGEVQGLVPIEYKVTLEAEANPGWTFVGWQFDDAFYENDYDPHIEEVSDTDRVYWTTTFEIFGGFSVKAIYRYVGGKIPESEMITPTPVPTDPPSQDGRIDSDEEPNSEQKSETTKSPQVDVEIVFLGKYPSTALPPGEVFCKIYKPRDPAEPDLFIEGYFMADLGATAYIDWIFMGFEFDEGFLERDDEPVFWETSAEVLNTLGYVDALDEHGATIRLVDDVKVKALYKYIGADLATDEIITATPAPTEVPSVGGKTITIEIPFSFEEDVYLIQVEYALSSGLTLVNANCTKLPLNSTKASHVVFLDINNINNSVKSGLITVDLSIKPDASGNQTIEILNVFGANDTFKGSSGTPQTHVIPADDTPTNEH